MEDKIIIFTKVVNFNAPCSVNKTQLKFLFKEAVGLLVHNWVCCVFHRCDECQNETKLFRGRKKNEKQCYQQLHHQQGLFTIMFFTDFYAYWNE